ncbi:uncharacterized protein LOC144095229 [Amblyomma americanum]
MAAATGGDMNNRTRLARAPHLELQLAVPTLPPKPIEDMSAPVNARVFLQRHPALEGEVPEVGIGEEQEGDPLVTQRPLIPIEAGDFELAASAAKARGAGNNTLMRRVRTTSAADVEEVIPEVWTTPNAEPERSSRAASKRAAATRKKRLRRKQTGARSTSPVSSTEVYEGSSTPRKIHVYKDRFHEREGRNGAESNFTESGETADITVESQQSASANSADDTDISSDDTNVMTPEAIGTSNSEATGSDAQLTDESAASSDANTTEPTEPSPETSDELMTPTDISSSESLESSPEASNMSALTTDSDSVSGDAAVTGTSDSAESLPETSWESTLPTGASPPESTGPPSDTDDASAATSDASTSEVTVPSLTTNSSSEVIPDASASMLTESSEGIVDVSAETVDNTLELSTAPSTDAISTSTGATDTDVSESAESTSDTTDPYPPNATVDESSLTEEESPTQSTSSTLIVSDESATMADNVSSTQESIVDVTDTTLTISTDSTDLNSTEINAPSPTESSPALTSEDLSTGTASENSSASIAESGTSLLSTEASSSDEWQVEPRKTRRSRGPITERTRLPDQNSLVCAITEDFSSYWLSFGFPFRFADTYPDHLCTHYIFSALVFDEFDEADLALYPYNFCEFPPLPQLPYRYSADRLERFNQMRKISNVTFIVSFDADELFKRLAARKSPENMKLFAKNVRVFLRFYDFDGFDIYKVHFTDENLEMWTDVLKVLNKELLPSGEYLLSIGFTYDADIPADDLVQPLRYVSFSNLVTHVAPIDIWNSTVVQPPNHFTKLKQAVERVQAVRKLQPNLVMCYTLTMCITHYVVLEGTPFDPVRGEFFNFHEMSCDRISEMDTGQSKDDGISVVSGDGSIYYAYDTTASLLQKIRQLDQHGMCAAMFDVQCDDTADCEEGRYSRLEAVKKEVGVLASQRDLMLQMRLRHGHL